MEAGSYRIIIIIIINIILNFEFTSHVPVWHCPLSHSAVTSWRPAISNMAAGPGTTNHWPFSCVKTPLLCVARCNILLNVTFMTPTPPSLSQSQVKIGTWNFHPACLRGPVLGAGGHDGLNDKRDRKGKRFSSRCEEMLASSNECVCEGALKVVMKGGPATHSQS